MGIKCCKPKILEEKDDVLSALDVSLHPNISSIAKKSSPVGKCRDCRKPNTDIYKKIRAYLQNSNFEDRTTIKIYGFTQDPHTQDYMIVTEYANQGNLRSFLVQNHRVLNWERRLQQKRSSDIIPTFNEADPKKPSGNGLNRLAVDPAVLKIHPDAHYTSRPLNFMDLPEPTNFFSRVRHDSAFASAKRNGYPYESVRRQDEHPPLPQVDLEQLRTPSMAISGPIYTALLRKHYRADKIFFNELEHKDLDNVDNVDNDTSSHSQAEISEVASTRYSEILSTPESERKSINYSRYSLALVAELQRRSTPRLIDQLRKGKTREYPETRGIIIPEKHKNRYSNDTVNTLNNVKSSRKNSINSSNGKSTRTTKQIKFNNYSEYSDQNYINAYNNQLKELQQLHQQQLQDLQFQQQQQQQNIQQQQQQQLQDIQSKQQLQDVQRLQEIQQHQLQDIQQHQLQNTKQQELHELQQHELHELQHELHQDIQQQQQQFQDIQQLQSIHQQEIQLHQENVYYDSDQISGEMEEFDMEDIDVLQYVRRQPIVQQARRLKITSYPSVFITRIQHNPMSSSSSISGL
ncbi:2356_t:CDS:2 [Diversispora eburnea]|uniref:2356_t:CDS:1 n=1 Tax=Diversispora eburnea TaxID=1213867 RepID=A0A9N8UXW2_9GLOM|nr:2356_t:CDS:2 [Diversispora eburnea]